MIQYPRSSQLALGVAVLLAACVASGSDAPASDAAGPHEATRDAPASTPEEQSASPPDADRADPAASAAVADSETRERPPPPGWTKASRNGVTYWCVVENPTGTRVRKARRCLTPSQYDTMQQDNRDWIDALIRNTRPSQGN